MGNCATRYSFLDVRARIPAPSLEDYDNERFHTHRQSWQCANVDVSAKAITQRVATAEGYLYTRPDVIDAIKTQSVAKGDVLAVARVAGIMRPNARRI